MASGIGAAAVEMVRPFEALEQSRRDRIESDKRQKREEAEQRKREREEKAQQEAQRKREAATAKAAQGAVPRQPTYLLSLRQTRQGCHDALSARDRSIDIAQIGSPLVGGGGALFTSLALPGVRLTTAGRPITTSAR
jgi:hypothetical protein